MIRVCMRVHTCMSLHLHIVKNTLSLRFARLCVFVQTYASVSSRKDQSRLQVFEELPGGFPVMSPAWSGRAGMKECTDVLSESAFFELSPEQRNPNPDTWASDYGLMPHLDLRSQNTKERVKCSGLTPGSEIKHIPNPAVSIMSQSHVRLQMTFMVASRLRLFLKRVDLHDCKFNPRHREVTHGDWQLNISLLTLSLL